MKYLKIISISLLILAVALIATAEWFLHYALKPALETRLHMEWTDSVLQCKALRDTFIISNATGDSLHAWYLRSDSATNKVAILVHGYSHNGLLMGDYAVPYDRQLHYNIVLPDLHYHGKSKGEFLQMGCIDRLDILQWCGVADTLFGGNTHQVLHGVSMGAATIMSVSGEKLPPYIKCFVEDCGYTSAWDEFSNQMKAQFSLPEFPMLYVTSALCRVQLGWSFGSITPLEQVAKCHKPMLFIHGSNDKFVLTPMVYQLYKAKPQPKQIWISQGSGHAKSVKDHPTDYAKQIVNFVQKNI